MILEYVVIVIVTIGIVMGIILGKYKLVKRNCVLEEPSTNLSDNTEEIDEFIIKQTQERINQELQNISADELKANVVSAISVVFAILAVSEFLRIYSKINADIFWLPFILIVLSTVTLFISFLCGLKVLYPRENRFDMWKPRDTNESYASNSDISKYSDIRKEWKKELISNFESMQKSRDKDGYFLKFGYGLLIGGASVSIFILLLIHLLWVVNDGL